MKTILIRNKDTKVQYVWQTENFLILSSLPEEIRKWIFEEKAEPVWILEGTGNKIKKEVKNRLEGENRLLLYRERETRLMESDLIFYLMRYFPNFKPGFTFSKQQGEEFIKYLKEKYGITTKWGECYNILKESKLESYKSSGTTKYKVV